MYADNGVYEKVNKFIGNKKKLQHGYTKRAISNKVALFVRLFLLNCVCAFPSIFCINFSEYDT